MNVYSFDHAMYHSDCVRDFYKFCCRRHKGLLRFLPGKWIGFIRYKLGCITEKQYQERHFAFLRGITDAESEVALFWNTHKDNFNTWFSDWKRPDDVMISAAPEFLLQPIADKLHYMLVASQVDPATGKIAGQLCYGEEKVKQFFRAFPGATIETVFTHNIDNHSLAQKAQRAFRVQDNRLVDWNAFLEKRSVKKKKQAVKAYEKICEMTTADFYRRFLPYCVGSPDTEPTYQLHCGDQYQRVNLVCFADSHIAGTQGAACLDNVEKTIRFANKAPIPFDAVIHAGDIITPHGLVEKKTALAHAKQFFTCAKKCKLPFIFVKGNHDLNDWGNLPENAFTDKDWSDLFLDFAQQQYQIKRQSKANGEQSTWHYYDIHEKKIRIVAVDILDIDHSVVNEQGRCKHHGGNSWYISNEQMQWIVDEAFNLDDKQEKDWGIVLTLHMYPKDSAFHANAADVLLEICAALNNQQAYVHKYKHEENSFFDLDIRADFTRYAKEEKKPVVICWLLGHDHERKYRIRKGIPIIYIIHGACTSISSDPRVARIPGTCTQNAFDVVNIDTKHRKIRVFAYGATTTCYGESGDRFLPDGLSY